MEYVCVCGGGSARSCMSPFKVGRVLNIKYSSINHNQTIRQFKPETVIGFALFKPPNHARTHTHTHACKQRILILSCKCRSHQNSKPPSNPWLSRVNTRSRCHRQVFCHSATEISNIHTHAHTYIHTHTCTSTKSISV